MAKTALEVLFKQFRDNLQKNSDFRAELNKATTHYIEEDIEALKSQLSSIGKTAEKDFDKNYRHALQAIKDKGMSDSTFNRLQSTVKTAFLNNFTELKEAGIDIGHVQSNLTLASKTKASELVFGQDTSLRRNNIDSLTDQDLQDIAKTLALLNTYIQTLENLDNIQDRQGLIKFLKTSGTFKKNASTAHLSTLEGIKSFISQQFSYQGSKGFNDLSKEILSNAVMKIDVDTTVNFKRNITSTNGKIAVTFEVAAFNRLKGTISKGIRDAFTDYLDILMKDSSGLSKQMNDALTKAVKEELTKDEFSSIFPRVSASKTVNEVISDLITDIIKGNIPKNYSSSKQLKNITSNISSNTIKVPNLKVKVPKAKTTSISRTSTPVTKNLISLQNLINQNLAAQIKKNMGTGTATRVLNYRTGRFAESAKVEKLSESRAGMITAFYSYMRNPYGTFAEGGAQEFPTSRNPKTLIAMSIRQLAGAQVANRMRAVLV